VYRPVLRVLSRRSFIVMLINPRGIYHDEMRLAAGNLQMLLKSVSFLSHEIPETHYDRNKQRIWSSGRIKPTMSI